MATARRTHPQQAMAFPKVMPVLRIPGSRGCIPANNPFNTKNTVAMTIPKMMIDQAALRLSGI